VKGIRHHAISRHLHLAQAGMKAGWGWTKGLWNTLLISDAEEKQTLRHQNIEKQIQQLVQDISQLKGGVVKLGQILATYADYCFPPVVASALHQLESDTDPLSWSCIAPHIEAALGDKRTDLIIEPTPLAAASLSQAHKARIKISHQPICLKILYPDIDKALLADFSVLKASLFLWMDKKQREEMSSRADEIIAVLLEEIDLQKEAQKLLRWGNLLANDDRFIVPQVYEEYSTSTILAMSFEQGVSQNDPVIQTLSQDRRNYLAQNMLELLLSEVFLWGEIQTDPHAGNYRIYIADEYRPQDTIVLLDFGSVRILEPSLLKALRKMILAAYWGDKDELCNGMIQAGFLSEDTANEIKDIFCSVLLGLAEPLNYKMRLEKGEDIPSYTMDEAGNYCWAAAKLPKRMGKLALKSAFSQHFQFPGVEFMLVARKLAGVYSFIAALDARFDGSVVMENIIQRMNNVTEYT